MKLHLKVKPSSSKDEVICEPDGSLKVKIRAPAIEGKANLYLIKFLSEKLALPTSKISLLKGKTSSHKTLEIEANEAEVFARLLK